MSTNKLLQSLSEDPQLEKQIGCMAGILQLFDRHQVLTGRRLYGHKRIAAAVSKPQTPLASNCGSPTSESNGIASDNALRYSNEEPNQKHTPVTAVAAASSEQQRSLPRQMPTTPTELKSSFSFARTPSPTTNEASTEVNSRDQMPKISFDIGRGTMLAPRRLDSSRSLHEARMIVPTESKVYARKSVDTAERAAAAARGALKELSRISNDFTGPNHPEDQASIRDIVRSTLGQDQQARRSTASSLRSSSPSSMQSTFTPRMAGEAGMYTTKASFAKDKSRAHESKSSSECHPLQASSAPVPQAGRHVEASRPPRHNYKPKMETSSKTSADISESLRMLAKLRETPPIYKTQVGQEATEEATRSKNSSAVYHPPQPARSLVDLAREGPALSSKISLQRVSSERAPASRMSLYEPSRASCVDSLLQGGLKAREGPRLSLDSRGLGSGIKADQEAGTPVKLHPRSLLSSRSVSCSNSECDTESLHEKRTSFSSNVVAKLMGLDEIPTGDERPHAHPKSSLSGASDTGATRVPNTAIQDMNPTFSQCGKYVSASFFPSKRRDDTKIAIDLEEEEEEDNYLHLEPLSHQEARTLNVRVGSLKLHAGDRLVSADNANHLGPPCYQRKNHHLMEDRPPHVLSPAARICAQIEEMQRGDSSYKELDRGTRALELQQSSKTELEALKQLLSAIQFKKNEGSHVEKLQMWETPRKPQLEVGRMPLLHELHCQAEQPPPVPWNTKTMLNNSFDYQIHDHISNRNDGLRNHNRKLNNGIHEEATMPDNYNQGPRFQSGANISSGSSYSSLYNTPRKATISTGYNSPRCTRNVHTSVAGVRKIAADSRTPPQGMSAKNSTPPRTPLNQQQQTSHNVSGSWEVSSMSSTSSNNARDHYVTGGNSSSRAANNQNRQSERVEKKKGGILKEKEERKSNLVSLKPSLTEKKSISGGALTTAKLNSRVSQRHIQTLKSEKSRSSVRSPTKSSAKKVTEVKRKLNFSSRTRDDMHASELGNEDQEAGFIDKTVVSSVESMRLSSSSVPTSDLGEAGHDVMDEDPCVSVKSHANEMGLSVASTNINHQRTEGGTKSSMLLLSGTVLQASHTDQQAASSILDMGADVVSSVMCTPKGALRLSQVLPQENEDTESQGDKSTGSCEQPSPISVLEGPFYEDDVASPPTPTKFVLKLKELEEEARGKARTGSSAQNSSESGQNSLFTDFEYVKHLLEHSCLLQRQSDSDNADDVKGVWKLRPLDSHYFLQLEEELACNAGNDAACKSELGSSMWRRKMLFDSVNTSLEWRLHAWCLCQHQPWLLACESSLCGTIASGYSGAFRHGIVGVDEGNNLRLSREGGKVLLEEVWEEIESKGAKQRGISSKLCILQDVHLTSASGGDEEDEGTCDDVGHMLEEDILGRSQRTGCPDAWNALLLEKGELGLDLERLIFKDLVDHTIRDLGLLLLAPLSLTTKRQLFKAH